MSSLFGNMFGAAVGDPHGQGGPATASPPNRPSSAPSGSRHGGRSFSFNMPGGGRGQVVIGSFNGGGGDPFGNNGMNGMNGMNSYAFFTSQLKLRIDEEAACFPISIHHSPIVEVGVNPDTFNRSDQTIQWVQPSW